MLKIKDLKLSKTLYSKNGKPPNYASLLKRTNNKGFVLNIKYSFLEKHNITSQKVLVYFSEKENKLIIRLSNIKDSSSTYILSKKNHGVSHLYLTQLIKEKGIDKMFIEDNRSLLFKIDFDEVNDLGKCIIIDFNDKL